jgi:hypothetical protein
MYSEEIILDFKTQGAEIVLSELIKRGTIKMSEAENLICEQFRKK